MSSEQIIRSLAHDGAVTIANFGRFEVRDYKSYLGLHPHTGEPIVVPAKKLPFVSIDPALKSYINGAGPLPSFSWVGHRDEDVSRTLTAELTRVLTALMAGSRREPWGEIGFLRIHKKLPGTTQNPTTGVAIKILVFAPSQTMKNILNADPMPTLVPEVDVAHLLARYPESGLQSFSDVAQAMDRLVVPKKGREMETSHPLPPLWRQLIQDYDLNAKNPFSDFRVLDTAEQVSDALNTYQPFMSKMGVPTCTPIMIEGKEAAWCVVDGDDDPEMILVTPGDMEFFATGLPLTGWLTNMVLSAEVRSLAGSRYLSGAGMKLISDYVADAVGVGEISDYGGGAFAGADFPY